MNDKNRETSTIKQTFSYGKSKTVTVEVVKKKKQTNKKIFIVIKKKKRLKFQLNQEKN